LGYLIRIGARVENEPGVDNISGQRKEIDGSQDQMVPTPGDIQASQRIVTPSLVLDCKQKFE
jgi:hypothetical protein